MARIRSLRRSNNFLIADLADALRPRPRRNPLGTAWRWRYETALVSGAVAAIAAAVSLLGAGMAVACTAGLLAISSLWPPGRRWLVAGAWWLVTPHLLHSGFVQARIQSRSGRVPFIWRTTREVFGERAHVWCPAGTSADDMRAARGILRAACWAADVQVMRHERHAHLVLIDVIRRGPGAAAAPSADGQGSVTQLAAWRETG